MSRELTYSPALCYVAHERVTKCPTGRTQGMNKLGFKNSCVGCSTQLTSSSHRNDDMNRD